LGMIQVRVDEAPEYPTGLSKQRVLPHVSALISRVAAYLSLGLLLGLEETGPLAVAATFALVGIPVLGAAVGSPMN